MQQSGLRSALQMKEMQNVKNENCPGDLSKYGLDRTFIVLFTSPCLDVLLSTFFVSSIQFYKE